MRCVEHFKENCEGEVKLRESLTGTGTPIARCDFHWERRLEKQEEMYVKDADYRKVDYLDAGERYDEEY